MFKFLLSSSSVVVVGGGGGGGIGVVVMHVPAYENPMLVWTELKTDTHRKKNLMLICMPGIGKNKICPKVSFTSRELLLNFKQIKIK